MTVYDPFMTRAVQTSLKKSKPARKFLPHKPRAHRPPTRDRSTMAIGLRGSRGDRRPQSYCACTLRPTQPAVNGPVTLLWLSPLLLAPPRSLSTRITVQAVHRASRPSPSAETPAESETRRCAGAAATAGRQSEKWASGCWLF